MDVSETMIEVRAVAASIDLSVLDDTLSAAVVARFVEHYVEDPRSTWWWQSVKGPTRAIGYGQNDGLVLIQSLVSGDDAAYLIVTDEQAEPLGVVSGAVAALLALVQNCRSFEFVLVDPEFGWAIFDTHDNRLVCAGTLVSDDN